MKGSLTDVTERQILETLADFQQEIMSLRTDRVTGRAIDFIHERVFGGHVSIALLEADQSGFRLCDVAQDVGELETGRFLPLESTILSRVIQDGKPLYRPDIRAEDTRLEFDGILLREGVRSGFLIPLVAEGQCLGTLNCSSREVDGLSEETRQLLILLAPSLAPALRNARLYDALRESEERYRTVADFAHDWECWVGPEGDFRYVSPSCERVTGYRPEEFIQDSGLLLNIVHPDDRAAVARHQTEVEASEEAGETLDFRILNREGEERWISHPCQTVRGSDGTWLGHRASNRDITNVRRGQEALRESQRYSRNIIESSPDMIITVDVDRRVVEFNRKAEEVFGYRSDEIVGEHVDILYADAKESRLVHETTLKKGAFAGGIQNRGRDGRLFPSRISSTVLRRSDGKVVGLLGISRDVTEQLKIEETLRLNESRFETLAQLGGMTKASLREIGDFVLPAAIELTGSRIGFLGIMDEEGTVLNLVSLSEGVMEPCAVPGEWTRFPVEGAGLWAEAIRQRRPIKVNDYAAANPAKGGFPEGHVPLTRIMAVPVIDGDQVTAVAVVGNKQDDYDESDLRQLILLAEGMWSHIRRARAEEELARRTERLEASLEEKEILLKEVHHRVKNNLQVVSSLLSLQVGMADDERAAEMFRDSQNRVLSMALVHESLYLSDDLARVDLGRFFQTAAARLFHLYDAQARGITLRADAGGASLSVSAAIPCGLIVNELLTNALQHAYPPGCKQGGEIRVGLSLDGGVYTLSVADNGVGLPAGALLDNTETLGLHLVVSLAKQLGGALELKRGSGAQSGGEGTTVEVTYAQARGAAT